MNESQAIAALNAIGEPTRLAILRHLVRAGPGGATAGAIAEAAGATSSRMSFHLAALSQAGLVTQEKVSRTRVYRASYATLGALIAYLIEDCCLGHASVMACCSPKIP